MNFTYTALLRLCLSGCLLLSSTTVAEDRHIEYQIKAGYLYNFIKFVTWPNINTENFNVCIVGHNPFGALLDPIEARTAFGLPIKLIKLKLPKKNQQCQIAYISNENQSGLLDQSIRIFANGKQTLLVGEMDGFTERGGMVAFVMRDNRIKLNISLTALRQSSLSMSANLLEAANLVGG